jgi:predicted TIM-barrel fold metal-dependent hydrolase
MPAHRIDVHHHMEPPGYIKAVGAERVYRQSNGRVPPGLVSWSPQQALEAMEQAGVATAINSLSSPGIWFGDVELSRRLAREANDYGARLARDYPGRFGVLASLPLPDVDGCLREIEHAYDVLKVDGVILMTSHDNRWPGEKEFAPVFDELNRRKAVVLMHPCTPGCCQGLITDIQDAAVEFLFDTVRALVSLLYSGTLSRCADIRFILCHNGSAVPVLRDRICTQWLRNPKFKQLVPQGPEHELKKLFYECAGASFRESFLPLLELVTPRQMLFGSDYPWGRLGIQKTIDGLLEQGFSADDLCLIERENALGLFPRFR